MSQLFNAQEYKNTKNTFLCDKHKTTDIKNQTGRAGLGKNVIITNLPTDIINTIMQHFTPVLKYIHE